MHELDRILVPIDFSDRSASVLHYVAELARTHDAEVTLLHVVDPAALFRPRPGRPFPGRPRAAAAATEVDIEPAILEDCAIHLRDLRDRELGRDVRARVEVRAGTPAEVILATAAALDAGLIVIATRGDHRPGGAGLGSTADRIVRRSPSPVLSLREPHLDRRGPAGRLEASSQRPRPRRGARRV